MTTDDRCFVCCIPLRRTPCMNGGYVEDRFPKIQHTMPDGSVVPVCSFWCLRILAEEENALQRAKTGEREVVVDEPLPPETEWALVDLRTGEALVVVLPDEPEEDGSLAFFTFGNGSSFVLTGRPCPLCGSLVWWSVALPVAFCGNGCPYEESLGEAQ